MANQSCVFYCFEALSASFQATEPPPFGKVLELWDAYELSQKEAGAPDAMDTDHLDDGENNSNDEDDDPASLNISSKKRATRGSTSTLQPPSISRLRSSDTPSSDSSASSTTSLFTNQSAASSATSYSSALRSPPTDASYPLFVTWNTISARSGSKHLRGCIGTFEALPLARGLETYALTSAFDDHRFNPIPASLLPQLSCDITLLANFTDCNGPLDWELGVHGIRISFLNKNGTRRYGATYLPDVAVEQGWSKEETLESLMRKAGWDSTAAAAASSSSTVGVARRLLRGGRSTSTSNADGSDDTSSASSAPKQPWEQVSNFKVVKYTGLKASASYSEWQEWRKWAESQGLEKSLRSR